MAKPSRDPTGQVTRIYTLRLTSAERTTYERAAKRANLTVSAWMRDRLSKAAEREAKRQ